MNYSHGCNISDSDRSGFADAIALAEASDVVIFFGGIDQTIESEGNDRTSIALPGTQLALIQELEKVVHSPLHVVIMSGSGLDLTYVRDSPQCASLIWMGYAGQSGGLAIANVIFGDFNPGARLPITIYPASYTDAVSMFDMQMRPSPTNPGRTYKFYTGQAVFEFGAGLSYTNFSYAWYNESTTSHFDIDSLMKNNFDAKKVLLHLFRVNVTNIGPVLGDDVVLAFVTPPRQSVHGQTPPIKKLVGFERVRLNVGETAQVFFPLDVDALLTVTHDGARWLEPGLYRFLVGEQGIHTVELKGNPARWS